MRGAGTQRLLTDLVSLVRHAVQLDDELVPYPELVQRRYQRVAGRPGGRRAHVHGEQRWWLDQIAEHIGVNLTMPPDDFDYGEFFDRAGGWGPCVPWAGVDRVAGRWNWVLAA